MLTLLSLFLISDAQAWSIGNGGNGGSGGEGTRGVSVVGECVKRVPTDRVRMTLTAQALESDVKSALEKATRSYNRVKEAIEKLKLENFEIKTVESSVFELKEWQKDRNVSKGFQARMGLELSTSSAAKIGDVLTIAGRENIKEMGSLQSYLSDDLKAKEVQACLELSAQNAKAKAMQLVKPLGGKVGAVLSIQEESSWSQGQPEYAPQMSMMRKSMDAAPAQVEGGFSEVRTRVQATFAIEK